MLFLLLFWEFFKTGLFAIGGGLATLPFLSRMAERFGWFTQEDIANMLAVSESTPGPIGVNMATYVGNTVITHEYGSAVGVLGGFCATFGLVLPSFLVILIVAKIFLRFQNNPLVESAMTALRPASVGMVCAAVAGVIWSVLFHGEALLAGSLAGFFLWPNLILFAALMVFYLKFSKLHPIVILALGAVAGILLKL